MTTLIDEALGYMSETVAMTTLIDEALGYMSETTGNDYIN